MKRIKCIICENNDLIDFLIIKEMPVFMGVTEKITPGLKSDMIFCECQNCKNIQLKNLLDLELIYSNNHNTEIVGELWSKHYQSFLNFVDSGFYKKNILEVGDPSAKIANLAENFNKWIIIEKNPRFESSDKVVFIDKFFEEEFIIGDKIDVIVHSHFFEHLYEPLKFLEKCRDILSDDGDMYFSIPDLRYFLDGDFLPNSILQFEHTYFIDKKYLEILCNKTGFVIVNSERYNNHSVFFHLRKGIINHNYLVDDIISNKFIDKYDILLSKIESINKQIEDDNNVYLYGAHVTSQSYIFNGLNTGKILGLLDGSSAKIDKYLYGTNLLTHDPSILKSLDNVTVICSHMGIYRDEISQRLKDINSSIKII